MFKKIFKPLALAAGLMTAAFTAHSQGTAYPDKPVRLVVPYAAGGPADLLGRMVAERLGSRLGQPVMIDNRPGVGGHTGGEHVARSAPDGYTLMLGTIAHHGATDLYKNLRYDPVKDLRTVAVIAEAPSVLIVNETLPVKSVQELLAQARANPGKLTYGSAGNGSAMHMAAELFKYMTKIDYVHVPYRGGAPAMNDFLGGQIHMLFESLGTAHPHIKSGKARPLAVTSSSRNPSLPDVPTVAEAGVADYSSVPWYTIAAPAALPDAIAIRLNTEINAVLKDPELLKRWEGIGVSPVGGSLQDAARRNQAEHQKWSSVIKAANLTLE